jgi:hypothetical protein
MRTRPNYSHSTLFAKTTQSCFILGPVVKILTLNYSLKSILVFFLIIYLLYNLQFSGAESII